MSANRFSLCLAVFAAFAFIVVIVVLGSNFRIVGLSEIYDVRSSADAITETSSIGHVVRYLQAWLASFVLPLYFAIGAVGRRRRVVVWVALGYVVLFGLSGSKSTLLFIPYAFFLYILLTRWKRNSGASYALALTSLLALTPVVGLVVPDVLSAYVAVVPFRAFSVPALTIPQYESFFQQNAVTHLSHVLGVSYFVKYPYSTDIGRTVGEYFYGIADLSCNAGFWASDGLSGFGPPGIVVLSLVCAFLFWAFDTVAQQLNPSFVALAAAFIGFSFGSTSLFTTLMTGGWALLMVTVLFLPTDGPFANGFQRRGSLASGGPPP